MFIGFLVLRNSTTCEDCLAFLSKLVADISHLSTMTSIPHEGRNMTDTATECNTVATEN